MRRYNLYFITCVLILSFLTSCGSSSNTTSGKTTVNINLGETKTASRTTGKLEGASAAIPAGIINIRFTISAADMATIERTISVEGRTTVTESFDITNGSNRHFLAEAMDSAGNVLYKGDTYTDLNGADVTLTIVMVSTDTTPPAFSGLSAITSITETSLTLSWSSATDNITSQDKIQYLVYVSTTSGGENLSSPSFTTSAGATSYTVTGLSPATTYYFIVRAKDEAGNIDTNTVEKSATTKSVADTTPPTFGGLVSATASSTTEISLSWNAAADNITSSSNIVYLIYMSTTSGGQNLAVPSFTTSAGATSYTVTGLSPTTTYYFIVRAKDEAGNIDTNTVEISATTLTPSDTTPPTFGGLVSATTLSSSEISLSWNAAADNVTSSANIAYLIYMSATSGGQNFSTPTSVVKGATSKTISGLTPSTTYYFVVRAMDEAGNIDSNTIEKSATTKSSDTTPPTVIIINPANGATNVSVDNVVSATFSEVMDSTTVNSSTFILKDSNNNPVDGTVAYSGVTASFIATSSLSYSTTYTATITTGVKDLAGNAMTSPYSWSFTTGSAPDTTAPTVISTSPADGATNISVTTTITVTFSETMDSSTINTTTFTLTDSSGNLIGGTVTYSGTTATFTPSTSLSYSTTYTATITTGVKDLAGNAMTSDYVWTFTTEASTLVEAHSKYWSDGYYVQFSYYDPGYTATSVSVTGYGITGSLTLTYNTTKGRWDSYTSPSNNLYLGTTYPTPPVTYTFTITDSTGTWTATDAVDCFMTEFATTLSPLGTVTTATPTFSWTAVSQTNMEYQVQLNDSSGSRIWDSQIGVDISSTTYNGPALTSGATYYYYVVVRPVGGDCESFAQGSFVYSAPDTTAPTVISTSPVNGGFDIPRTTTITATFSETVDCSTVNDTTFLLSWGGGSVAGTITCSGDTATFTPLTALSYNTTYTAAITTGVKDLAGNAMTSNYSWTFTSVEF